MSFQFNGIYTFIMSYLIFMLLGHSFLIHAREQYRKLIMPGILWAFCVMLTASFMVFLSRYFPMTLRVLLFFIQVSLAMALFFFLNRSSPIKRYDMPEDFLSYIYFIGSIFSSLFLLDVKETLAWHHAIGQAWISLFAVWMAALVSIAYKEKFSLTPAGIGLGGRTKIFFSAIIFYVILSVFLL
ncbi:hypothetical protein PVA45_06640 [Entomospira entomophila]|uniref:Uncharacterized protein n=1 Tax=Entomospira entomophila TaxID=2719988 RepID=A0A968KT91_9SPIO|nr:hypothetical protein [Entomospira entomophilus]NIZ41177.1 hypothetical protein [Entomospira entomophilus]WDI35384.1 hypothetical protein PVA45_06640 [Entomospira entomophilus]